MGGALVLILAGTFTLRSIAAARLKDAETELMRSLAIGEEFTQLDDEGCRGSPAAVLPFGSDRNDGVLEQTQLILDSFVLESALVRFSSSPIVEQDTAPIRPPDGLGLSELELQRDLTVKLHRENGSWCLNQVALEVAVVAPNGSIIDESLSDLVRRASDTDAADDNWLSDTDVLSHALACQCLSADEQSLLQDLQESLLWREHELR